MKGSESAKHDGATIIGANDDSPFDWVEESALSCRWPGMINVLGLRKEDLRYFVEQGIFSPGALQYGMWTECSSPLLSRFPGISKWFCKIPRFSEVGYDFEWQMIRDGVSIQTFNGLQEHYGKHY